MIETDRLILRRHRIDDLDPRAAIYTDAEHLRFVGGIQGREECWGRIQRYAGHWALKGHGLFALEERATGRFLGEAGFASFERGLGDDFDHVPEAAWVIAPSHAGRGLVEEAMRAATAWHQAEFGLTRMVAVIAAENHASLRLAAKLGFIAFAHRPYRDAPCVLLDRSPADPAIVQKRFHAAPESR